MRHRRHGFWTILAAIPILAVSGCVSRTMQEVSSLSPGLAFHPDPTDKDVLIYRNPKFSVTSYSKFIIEPATIHSNDTHRITPAEQAFLAESFRSELVKALESGYEIVETPGPGVLRLRTAIQDMQPTHVQLDDDKFLVVRMDTLLARVAMELEGVDSVSGERVAALIHTLTDRRYFEKGTTGRLLNVRDAFGIWTASLRKRFDAAKERASGAFEGIDPEEHRQLRFQEGAP